MTACFVCFDCFQRNIFLPFPCAPGSGQVEQEKFRILGEDHSKSDFLEKPRGHGDEGKIQGVGLGAEQKLPWERPGDADVVNTLYEAGLYFCSEL